MEKTTDSQFTCNFCSKTFSNKHTLATHQETAKFCLRIQGRCNTKFTCIACEKILSSKQQLLLHHQGCIKYVEFMTAKKYEESIKDLNSTIEKYKLKIEEYENKQSIITINKPSSVVDSTKIDLRSNILNNTIKINGVSLKNWLVVETVPESNDVWPNIPSEIMEMGEYAIMKYLGHEKGDEIFDSHRKYFINELDFAAMAAAKINVVRIPIGFWILPELLKDDTEYSDYVDVFAPNSLQYLDKAITEWAPKYNLNVIVSIQAARGSQNALPSSAPADSEKICWPTKQNIKHTIALTTFIKKRYIGFEAFLGISLLDNPSPILPVNILQKYYKNCIEMLSKINGDILLLLPIDCRSFIESTLEWISMSEISEMKNVMYLFDVPYEDQTFSKTQFIEKITYQKGNPFLLGDASSLPCFVKNSEYSSIEKFAGAIHPFWKNKYDTESNYTLRDLLMSSNLSTTN